MGKGEKPVRDGGWRRLSAECLGQAGRFPEALEKALAAELHREAAPAKRQAALRRLFALFTGERPRLGRLAYLDDPPLRDAYLRYHLPLNFARMLAVLRALPAGAAAGLTEVVDLGCGPGSSALAALFSLPGAARLDFRLFDRSPAALQVARRLLVRLAGPRPVTVQARRWSLPGLPELPPRALVLLGFVLNELAAGARRLEPPGRFWRELAQRLAPGALVVAVEPALRFSARRLQEAREAALASGQWKVLLPCTHERLCPLLAPGEKSWCHFRLAWGPPACAREAAAPLGLEVERPSFACLALGRRGGAQEQAAPAAVAAGPPRGRVIGDPMPVGRATGIYACAAGRRLLLARRPPGRRGATWWGAEAASPGAGLAPAGAGPL